MVVSLAMSSPWRFGRTEVDDVDGCWMFFFRLSHGFCAVFRPNQDPFQVPLEGWVQIVLFLGHYEGYFWRQDPKRAPGDYEGATGSDVVLEQGNDMMWSFQNHHLSKKKSSCENPNLLNQLLIFASKWNHPESTSHKFWSKSLSWGFWVPVICLARLLWIGVG